MIKKVLASLLLPLAFAISASAAVETVYLNNGSVIKGTIIETVPGKTYKIKTPDGSIVVCNILDVERIVNASEAAATRTTYSYDKYADGRTYTSDDDEDYGYQRAPRYRGFVGEAIGIGEYSHFSLYTVHGAQIRPWIFVGAGIALDTYTLFNSYVDFAVPVFADVRFDFNDMLNCRFGPFFDLRFGYSVGDVDGFYFAPSIGGEIYFGHSRINLGIHMGYEMKTPEYYWGGYYSSYYTREVSSAFIVGLTLGF